MKNSIILFEEKYFKLGAIKALHKVFRTISHVSKWIAQRVWKVACAVMTYLFIAPPQDHFIAESRQKALQLRTTI